MIDRAFMDVHPFLRVIMNRDASLAQAVGKRAFIDAFSAANGIHDLEYVSETFESTVARGLMGGSSVYVKSFHVAPRFESELVGLYHLREARVPQLVDVEHESFTIVTTHVNGRPFCCTDPLERIFHFLGHAHSIGCASLEEEGCFQFDERPFLQPYYAWLATTRFRAGSSLCLGDNHFANFLIGDGGLVSRVDLATLVVGSPCTLDLLGTLWNAADLCELPTSPSTLLESYLCGRNQTSNLTVGCPSATELADELDVLAPLYDVQAKTFADHYCRLLQINAIARRGTLASEAQGIA